MSEATIFLKWVRYAVDVALREQTFVIINMDETGISNVETKSPGLRPRCRPHQAQIHRVADAMDRSNVKTTLLAAVCNSARLQPHLPQVVLPKYTKGARPPHRLLAKMAATGEPLEYWHGSGGYATTKILKKWATRVRSVVHSFNSDAWILLVWDCSQVHFNVEIATRLKRLGILVVMIPAKLTSLLQICDVYVFRELKNRLRMHQSFLRMTASGSRLEVGDWISCCGNAVREVVVSRCWEDAFDKMGLGCDVASIEGRARRAVHPDLVTPALPKRAELARLTNKELGGDMFRRVHKILINHFLEVRDLLPNTSPPRGALVPVPDLEPARKRQRHDADAPWDLNLANHLLASSARESAVPHGRAPAINRYLFVGDEV
jgi:hypothetical protein